jgi:RNA polymerase sigma-70 factor (ECF subfamily)
MTRVRMTRDRGELPRAGCEGGLDETDEKLMLRAGKGDKGAFDEIVRRYASKMVNLAYRITGDRELAEDIGQETFLRAYRSAARYKEISKFSTWLHTIAINLCRNELRRRKFRMYSLEGMAERDEVGKIRVDIADEKSTPDREAERKELGELIKEAVEELPEKFKTPLVLRDMQGLSYEEIGKMLDLPEGTVKSRINRARLRVKEVLEPILKDKDAGGSTV